LANDSSATTDFPIGLQKDFLYVLDGGLTGLGICDFRFTIFNRHSAIGNRQFISIQVAIVSYSQEKS